MLRSNADCSDRAWRIFASRLHRVVQSVHASEISPPPSLLSVEIKGDLAVFFHLSQHVPASPKKRARFLQTKDYQFNFRMQRWY